MPDAPESRFFWKVANLAAAAQARAFRLSGGRLGGKLKGARVVVLHHVGARSGKARVSPVMGLVDGDRVIVVASKGGTESNPAWYHNLVAHPDVSVEVGPQTRDVHARVVEGEEREALWPRLVEFFPDFADYATRADRVIPVIALDPR